jgi:hypothetical protein
MALSIQLPLQATQYIPTSTSFNAPFNTDVTGKYSFNNLSSNLNVPVLKLEFGSYYLIERMFISGNLTAEDYLSSVDDPLTIPKLQIKRVKDSVCSHVSQIPVVQFTINREAPIYIKSDKLDDYITLSLTGVVSQLPQTVGLDPIIITIGLSVYQINEKFFNQGLRTRFDSDFGLAKKSSS